MNWQGAAVGALSLALLQVVVSKGSGRVAGLTGGAVKLATKFLDPTVPAFGSSSPNNGPPSDASASSTSAPAQVISTTVPAPASVASPNLVTTPSGWSGYGLPPAGANNSPTLA